MPIADTQMPYPTPVGRAVEAEWGVAVAESVVQKFTSTTDRDTKWTAPKVMSLASTASDKLLWFHDGSVWRRIAQYDADVAPMMPKAGGTFTGPVYTTSTVAIRRTGDNPYIEFQRMAGTQLGYIQARDASNDILYNVVASTDVHRFAIAGSGRFVVDNDGADVVGKFSVSGLSTLAGIQSNGTVTINPGGDQCLVIRGTSPYLDWWNEAASVQYGYIRGFTTRMYAYSVTDWTIQTAAAGEIHLAAGTGGLRLQANADIHIVPDNTYAGFFTSSAFIWGKAASDLANAGIEMFGAGSSAEGRIMSTVDKTGVANLYLRHQGAADANGVAFVQFVNGGGGVLSHITEDNVAPTGIAINNCTVTPPSDYRMKDVLGPITDALSRVKALRPLMLAWKGSGIEFEGFLAHEVQEVAPYAVDGVKDAVYTGEEAIMMGVEEGAMKPQQFGPAALVALLTAGLQELVERVELLEAA